MEAEKKEYKGSFIVSEHNSVLSGNQITYRFQNDYAFNQIDLNLHSFSQVLYNISSAYGNNVLIARFNGLGTNYTLTFTDGYYTIT